jgi:hypothetical protein
MHGFILHLQTNVHSYILKYFVTVCDLICVMRIMYNVRTRQLCEHLWTKIHIEKSVSPCHCHTCVLNIQHIHKLP